VTGKRGGNWFFWESSNRFHLDLTKATLSTAQGLWPHTMEHFSERGQTTKKNNSQKCTRLPKQQIKWVGLPKLLALHVFVPYLNMWGFHLSALWRKLEKKEQKNHLPQSGSSFLLPSHGKVSLSLSPPLSLSPVLEFELRILGLLGKQSSTWVMLPGLFWLYFFK
jgi:hypothetical protein